MVSTCVLFKQAAKWSPTSAFFSPPTLARIWPTLKRCSDQSRLSWKQDFSSLCLQYVTSNTRHQPLVYHLIVLAVVVQFSLCGSAVLIGCVSVCVMIYHSGIIIWWIMIEHINLSLSVLVFVIADHGEEPGREFQFDLSRIPEGEAITAAEFRIYKNFLQERYENETFRVSVYQVLHRPPNRYRRFPSSSRMPLSLQRLNRFFAGFTSACLWFVLLRISPVSPVE